MTMSRPSTVATEPATPATARAASGDRKAQLDTLAVVLLVGCCAIWGLGQVAAKVSLTEIPPLMQAAVRSVGALALLALWSAWRGLPLWRADGTGRAGWLAGLLFAAEFACIFVGLQYTTASRMVVFLYMSPFVVALGMPFIARHERLHPPQLLGLVVAFAGVVWAFAEGLSATSADRPLQWLGDALVFAAAVFWALTTLVLRAGSLASAAPEKALMYQLAVSAGALALASVAAGEAWPAVLTGRSLWPLAFQTVIVTFASYLVWFWLIRHYPATLLSTFTLLTPVFGLVAGAALLAEPITLRLVVALVAVCAGLYLVSRPRTPTPETSR
jgi:drug/metabolite transporter (DMT)-like permease